ncbi:hypothetical protein DPEC_G00047570 [Dallia pectoralis]|uniref:Uncharacterized protein n=1 Tax=Dallia pectoralis TaxID=75939 RepID=A0ACC2HAA2_DALPE|nr:hypothetical protein DPEC_G00047570 [Dallia pectoralis]
MWGQNQGNFYPGYNGNPYGQQPGAYPVPGGYPGQQPMPGGYPGPGGYPPCCLYSRVRAIQLRKLFVHHTPWSCNLVFK